MADEPGEDETSFDDSSFLLTPPTPNQIAVLQGLDIWEVPESQAAARTRIDKEIARRQEERACVLGPTDEEEGDEPDGPCGADDDVF